MTKLILAMMGHLIIFASAFSMERESTEFVDICPEVKLIILGFVAERKGCVFYDDIKLHLANSIKLLQLTIGCINKELHELAQSRQLCEPINLVMKELITSRLQGAKELVGNIGKNGKGPLVTGLIITFIDMVSSYSYPRYGCANLITWGINRAWPNDHIKLLLAHITEKELLNTALLQVAQQSTNERVHRDSDVELAKMLIEHGADVDVRSDNNYTPLMLVVKNIRPDTENEALVNLFIKKFAYIDARNTDGATALMMACYYRNEPRLQIACLLMDAGADLDIKDDSGQTAQEIAIGCGSPIAGLIDAYEIGSFWVDLRKFFSFDKRLSKFCWFDVCFDERLACEAKAKECCYRVSCIVVLAGGGCCLLLGKLFEAVKLKRD